MSKLSTHIVRDQRADIQYLRAFAVLSVVIFHFWPNLLPGGFVGVDIFFGISGFLITDLMMREAATTGTVRLSNFWARRLRRLLPASLLTILVSMLITLLIVPKNLID